MNRYVHVALAFLLALFTVQAQAGIVIGGTRVVYDGDKKEASASIRNPEKSGVYLVQSWVDNGERGGKAPFIVTPPLFRINPGEENMLRIIRTGGNLPPDRESVFWLNVKSIPATDDSKPHTNVLQVVVKSRLNFLPTGGSGRASGGRIPPAVGGPQRQSPDYQQSDAVLRHAVHPEGRWEGDKECGYGAAEGQCEFHDPFRHGVPR